MDLNEFRTRREKIDISLGEQGWKVDNPSHVRVEVDTKQSNFKKNDYKPASETLKNDLESKYADYVLLDDQGAPLAVIEAKRTSKDPLLTAQTQAQEYAEDIIKQTDKNVFIFLSNGYQIYFWNYPHENPRLVKAFFPKSDLEKLKWINENKRPLEGFEISHEISNRPKAVECAKRTLEHLNKGHRKALIVMATGTGKTRVAMAIIDILKKYKWVKKVLFVADRKTLRRQAMNKGYKKYFDSESKETIYSGVINKEKNLYATTIQTLQECYQDISPAYFDLIISDEAHRSIYNKWKDIFTYYDCIQIGLTATPREAFGSDDMRDTFRFFECNGNNPTALYDYEEAVEDGILVDFRKHIQGAQTNFQIKGLKKTDLTESQIYELIGQGINPEEINFEGTQFEKKFVTKGTNEAIIKEFMENCLMDQSGTLPAKSIIFAMTKNHAKRLLEAFYKLYPDYTGVAKVIVSEDTYSQKAVEDFEKEDLPRVAISVDMLDTGVDIEEVCNLVFSKPVFSKIKFWQMLGRGTRVVDDPREHHFEWVPEGGKKYFKVFDFFNVFDYFNMKPEGDKTSPAEAVSIKLFKTRVEQLALFLSKKDKKLIEKAKSKILKDVEELPLNSAPIKEKLQDIEKVKSDDFYTRKGLNPIEFLHKKIAPLMKYKTTNYDEASFVLKCEKLILAILRRNKEQVDRFSEQIAETLECIPENINGLNVDLLKKARREDFWIDIGYVDVQELIDEFAPFIKYKTPEPIQQIVVDIGDTIVQRKIIEFGPDAQHDHVKSYKEKVEKKIKELVSRHPTIKKILENKQLTDKDIEELENTLNSPELYLTEDVLRQFYRGTFIQFIKEILGMYKHESRDEQIKKAFETYLIENNKKYNADQFEFIRTLQTVFIKEKHVEYDMLWEPPFENLGFAPTDLFSEAELKEWVNFCKKLEAEA